MITFLLLATPAAGGRCGAAVQTANAQLHLADRATARRDGRAANAALDAGLAALGNAYASPPTLDDTGMHLVLATVEQRKGRFAKAALLKRRVLMERLQLCGGAVRDR